MENMYIIAANLFRIYYIFQILTTFRNAVKTLFGWGGNKTFTLLYGKFVQDTMYQIISESVEFYRNRDEKHLGLLSRNTVRL